MSFPGPNQPPSNGGGNKPNGGNNPFTNPFSRNNDGKNGGSGANGNKSNGPRPFWQSPWLWVVVVALLAVTMFQLFAGAGSQTIDTKDGMQILNGNTVEYATIVDNTQQVKLKLSSDYSATDPDTGRTKNYGKNVQFYYTYAQSAAVVKAVQKADPAKGWTASMQQTSIWTYLLTSLLPFLIIFGLFWFLMSRMGGAAGGMFGMGSKKNSGKLLDGQTPTTKFSDVAGEDAAVQEVEEIKDFLKDPSRYKALGARIPRGVLLYGPPGTGKTFAVERLVDFLGWPSFQIDASSVASPYIHETSKKVAQVFDKAMENAPSVLVIDEMEAFLADREMGSGHHRVEEVAEFLRRIPEAVKNEVLIITMTNRIDMIDPAIQRRGRFDHVIKVDFASEIEVQSLLDKLLSALPKESDVDSKPLAQELAGRPLSDVAFVVREGARLAARSGKDRLEQASLLAALRTTPAREREGSEKRSIGFI